MRKLLQIEEIVVGTFVFIGVFGLALLGGFFDKPDTAFNLWIEIAGSALIFLFGWAALRWVRIDRKAALRRLLRNHGFMLHGWIMSINGIIGGDWVNEQTKEKWGNLKSQCEKGLVEKWMYIGFLRTLVITNENAKRVIDINDSISADTILRLEGKEIEVLYNLTMQAYYLVGNFEYMINRLAHRDFMKHGYGDFDPDQAAGVIQSLIKDIGDFDLSRRLEEFSDALGVTLTTLGESETDISVLLKETQWQMTISEDGIPKVKDPNQSMSALANPFVEKNPTLYAFRYNTTRSLNRALKDERRKHTLPPKSPIARIFGGRSLSM